MTEREIVLRERAAYARGAFDGSTECGEKWTWQARNIRAARLYPLPKVILPRVVKDRADIAWRFVEGRLEFRAVENWYPMLGEKGVDNRYGIALFPTPERITIWADLLARPTEEVEE